MASAGGLATRGPGLILFGGSLALPSWMNPVSSWRISSMLPGPVFNVELVTTARRARYYVVRVVYGLLLLFVLWQSYHSYFSWRPEGEVSIQEMSRFAQGTFYSFALTQLGAVLVLTPALLAGVIADERQ